jgi:hypothetical protein
MKDKDCQIQIKRIRTLKKKWHSVLGLNWWRVDYDYSDQEGPRGEGTYAPPNATEWISPMETTADPYYLKAAITFYLPHIIDMSDDELEEGFLHELMHVFLSPMHSRKTAKEEELVATKLAQAVKWTHEECERKNKLTTKGGRVK